MLSLENAFKSCPLAFGGASISGEGGGYGFGAMSEAQAISLLELGFEQGMRVFDTAPIYGFGVSEKRMGLGLKKFRDKTFIVSKCGVDWDQDKNVAIRNDPKTTQRMLETSLKTLNVDTIDLYMVHWPDANVDIRHTVEVLAKAQSEGKIRYIGLCNTSTEELSLAHEVANIDVVQNQFHLFDRVAEGLFADLASKGKGFMSWGTLDKGILSGSVTRARTYDQHDVRASETPWWSDEINAPKLAMMEKLIPWLKEQGHTPLEMALGHNIQAFKRSNLQGLALCGAKHSEQLLGLFKALENVPPTTLLNEILEQVKTHNL